MSNQFRAAIIALIQSVFPVLVLLGVDLSDDAIAAIMLVITNTMTLLALLFPGREEVVHEIVEAPAATPELRLDDVDLLKTLAPAESRSTIKPGDVQ